MGQLSSGPLACNPPRGLKNRACITKGPMKSRAALVILSSGTLPKSQTLADPWPGCGDKLIPAMYEQTILMATPHTPTEPTQALVHLQSCGSHCPSRLDLCERGGVSGRQS